MFFLIGVVEWFFELLDAHPWLWLVVAAVVIGGWVLGREQDYTKPSRPRRERRPTRAEIQAQERAAFERSSTELDNAYRQTKERLRRAASGDGS